MVLMLVLISTSCSDFDEINQRPNAFSSDEVSAKYFLTSTQISLYAPTRYPYWRAQLIHADRFAGQFCFGHNGSWWSDGLGYSYSSGYTNAAYDWLAGYNGGLTSYLNFVKVGGDLENERYFAIGLIMKGLYYQMFTDTFGMLPYTEASDPDIITPIYDTQAEIYKGIINELNTAMQIIGDHPDTGQGVDLLTKNDLFFNGDLQKWKKMANTLKLRLALRALGAPDAGFADAAINEAMQSDVLMYSDENALMEKDTEISQWANAVYGDVWWNFGGWGSKWTVGKTLIDYLRNNNVPRLFVYATPIEGGTVELVKPGSGGGADNFDLYAAFILSQLDDAGVNYTANATSELVTIVVADDKPYYVGQPTRLNGDIKTFVKHELFSTPADIVINKKNAGNPISPEVVLTAAEGNFLKAEAIVKGFSGSGGDAQTFYQEGIRQAMMMWGVGSGDIDTFIANEDMAQLNGTVEENLEKIAIQRWIADYTDGFEAWAVVRDTGYPKELAKGVSDQLYYSLGTLNGKYPQRMRYGSGAYNTNGSNTEAANAIQGSDEQKTTLWWAK